MPGEAHRPTRPAFATAKSNRGLGRQTTPPPSSRLQQRPERHPHGAGVEGTKEAGLRGSWELLRRGIVGVPAEKP